MSTRFRIGESSVLVVGVEGVVEAMTADTVTIAGTTLPIRFNEAKGIRYLSLLWPDSDPCAREHCGPECDVEPIDPYEDARDDLERVLSLIERNHYDEFHDGAFRTCSLSFCREVHRSLESNEGITRADA